MYTLLALSPSVVTRFPRGSCFHPKNSHCLIRKYTEESREPITPEEVVRWMGKHAPVFAHYGDQVSVLHEPAEFYETLKVIALIRQSVNNEDPNFTKCPLHKKVDGGCNEVCPHPSPPTAEAIPWV